MPTTTTAALWCNIGLQDFRSHEQSAIDIYDLFSSFYSIANQQNKKQQQEFRAIVVLPYDCFYDI